MKIKKGRDLKVGDVVREHGVIYEIDLNPDPEGFWGKPNIHYFCIHDAYYGPSGTWLELDRDFNILTDRKEILKVLTRIDCDMTKYIADSMQHRKEFQELKWDIVTELNKKMRKEKKAGYKSESES